MRHVLAAAVIGFLVSDASAQTLRSRPSVVHHVSVVTTASVPAVGAGETVTLWADITPRPEVHVYAAGAKGFAPALLLVAPPAGITSGKPQYPPAELISTLGVADRVPAYRKAFRIGQPVTIGSSFRSGQDIEIDGSFTYQACDDRVCYPTSTMPVTWRLSIR